MRPSGPPRRSRLSWLRSPSRSRPASLPAPRGRAGTSRECPSPWKCPESIWSLLKEIVPQLSRVALLWNPDNQVAAFMLREVQRAAGTMAIQLQPLAVRDPREFDVAFMAIARERAGALIVENEFLFITHRTRILDLVAKSRLPAVYGRREWAEAGGLMSHRPRFRGRFPRPAGSRDKKLKGGQT